MDFDRLLFAAAFAATMLLSANARAEDRKFTGTWDGFAGVPVYSKLVFHDDGQLTYCNVQNCRNVSCFKMAYKGSLDTKFSYADDLRSWKFEWTDPNRILGEFTNLEGETAFAWYTPEYGPLESLGN